VGHGEIISRELLHTDELETRKALVLLALLCAAAYAPAMRLPLFEDDYPLIALADQAGPAGALANPIFRVRATSCWVMLFLWRTFHLTPPVYHAASLLLHTLNTWLVFGIARQWPPFKAAAFWAAAFFA